MAIAARMGNLTGRDTQGYVQVQHTVTLHRDWPTVLSPSRFLDAND